MDNVLNLIGPFGKYQKGILFLTGLIASLSAMTIYATIFTAAEPSLKCEFSNVTTSVNSTDDQCKILESMDYSLESPDYICTFDDTYYGKTIATEWRLICNKRYLVGVTQTIYMVGTICGLFIGYFSDRFGRKPTLLALSAILSVVLVIQQLLLTKSIFKLDENVSYVIYCVGQFLVGAIAKAIYLVAYILIFELTTTKYSTIVSNIFLYMYVFGELIVLAIAYFFRDWHVLNWSMAGYSLIFIVIIIFIIPESPRYLIDKGENEKATQLLRKIAKFNGKLTPEVLAETHSMAKFISPEELENNKDNKNEKSNKPILKDIWSPRSNLIKTIIFVYLWFALSLLYYGVSLGITSLDQQTDPYLMYFFSCIAEVVASIVCLVVAVIPSAGSKDDSITWNTVVKIIFASIGKAMASAAFNSCYIYNTLLYPTHVRSTVVLFASNVGRIGSYISPQINLLQTLVWVPLPYIIFSFSAFVASFLVFFLPDPDKTVFLK